MQRDPASNELLNRMVADAIAAGKPINHTLIAQGAYPKIARARRRELTISRVALQVQAKIRRKLPKPKLAPQPIIPGLLGEERA